MSFVRYSAVCSQVSGPSNANTIGTNTSISTTMTTTIITAAGACTKYEVVVVVVVVVMVEVMVVTSYDDVVVSNPNTYCLARLKCGCCVN